MSNQIENQIINPDRLLSHVSKNEESGCWEWNGCKDRDGYGLVLIGSRTDKSRRCARVHRVAYAVYNSVSFDSMKKKVVMHNCDNRCCFNPDHLNLGTQKENVRDMINKQRAAWQH